MGKILREYWDSGGAYHNYVGRWSRPVAQEFISWLEPAAASDWLDIGCGTGALVETILRTTAPKTVAAIDRSPGFLAHAIGQITDLRARFAVADAASLPWKNCAADRTVSGLMLNFALDPQTVVNEMRRVTRNAGLVALYVWDYAEGMEMMRLFWDAVIEIRPQDAALDEANRFLLCQPGPLKALFHSAGLTRVQVRAIDIPTVFVNFEDYWNPFLGAQGSAPTYLQQQNGEIREAIREAVQARIRTNTDGSIHLKARAWAVQGMV